MIKTNKTGYIKTRTNHYRMRGLQFLIMEKASQEVREQSKERIKEEDRTKNASDSSMKEADE